jgi:pimeloyl-ACP methyl ester carboxylesterase
VTDVASMTYTELFAVAVGEARRKDIAVWDDTPPANCTATVDDGLRVHYLDWGGDDKPALVLLHGARVHAHVWDFFSLELRQYFHIYALDLPGHGDSDWPADGDYSRSHLAAAIAGVIDQLGLKSFVLMGHSLGGSVAALVAAGMPAPKRALRLVDTSIQPTPPPYPQGG